MFSSVDCREVFVSVVLTNCNAKNDTAADTVSQLLARIVRQGLHALKHHCGASSVHQVHHESWHHHSALSHRSSRINFFCRVNFLCWLLFRYPFHPHVTAVACKILFVRHVFLSLSQKYRWQVTAKHTCTLCMWLQIKWHYKLKHGYMVSTEHLLRQQQFQIAPAM